MFETRSHQAALMHQGIPMGRYCLIQDLLERGAPDGDQTPYSAKVIV